MVSFTRRTIVWLATLLMLTTTPSRAAAPAVVFLRPPDLWSFKVESQQVLADLGYYSEYAFEFYDEEEIRVRAADERAEIVEGTLRTILDGEPAYALIRLRGEDQSLWVVMNPGALQVAQMTPDGLKAADLPEPEVQRRLALLASLHREVRQRLGLRNFRPSVALRVRLNVAPVDVLTLVPGSGSIVRYAVSRPGTGNAAETLVVQVKEQTWTITWAAPTLTVTIVVGRRPTVRSYQLRPGVARDATAATALTLLRGARDQCGTGPVVLPLP